MTAPHLLATLRARGVRVARSGDALELDAPRGALADLLPDVQRFKPSLLELLASEEAGRRQAQRFAEPKKARLGAVWLDNLAKVAGTDAEGVSLAPALIHRAARRIEARNGGFWRRLNASDRHDLAVCVALLEASIPPEGVKT